MKCFYDANAATKQVSAGEGIGDVATDHKALFEKRVVSFLKTNGGRFHMAGINGVIVG
ncbi:hypothetical protein D3C87_1822710 [compost metagenome]